ncbi:MAG: hypothetical protein HY352_04435 [Candidatus Omnitrophica bacterium]|nr:hypothetical protein [Candidatus Omnitrophota bacterium]
MPQRSAVCRTTPRRGPSRRGWLLVGFIVLLSAVILALAGITFFLASHFRVTSLRQNQTKAIYLAQAGVMTALYNFRRGANITVGEQTVDAGPLPGSADDDVFRLQPVDAGSTQADFLLMNMRANVTFGQQGFCGSPRDRLQGWTVRNVLASGGRALVVESFKVNWDAPSGERVLRLDINGTGSDWQDANCVGIPPDTFIPLSVPAANRTLNAGARWATNRVWFTSSAMDGKTWIEITFLMADGSSRTAHWDADPTGRSADITIKSVGEVRRGSFPFILWRWLQAEYRICRAVSGTSCNAASEEERQPGALVSYLERMKLTP